MASSPRRGTLRTMIEEEKYSGVELDEHRPPEPWRDHPNGPLVLHICGAVAKRRCSEAWAAWWIADLHCAPYVYTRWHAERDDHGGLIRRAFAAFWAQIEAEQRYELAQAENAELRLAAATGAYLVAREPRLWPICAPPWDRGA